MTGVAGQPPIVGVVLAAGMSQRLGSPKQLLGLDGRSLVEHVVDRCLASRLDNVLVVIGHEAVAVRQALAGRDVFFVVNPRYTEGQGKSLGAGVEASGEADAVVVVLADQPGIDAGAIDRLIDARREGRALVAMAAYGEDRGHPVLFGRELFGELRDISGDTGGREILQRHRDEIVLVDGGRDRVPPDVDTDEDYARLLEQHSSNTS